MERHLQQLGSRPDSLSDQVYAAVREAIVNKTLAPGSTVTEAQLAKDLGVSKTPVREALLRLREVGLVQQLATRGVRVIEPTREAVVRAYEVREVLEAATARLAALRGGATHWAELDEHAARSLEAAQQYDAPGFGHWDRKFHDTVWAAAGNGDLARYAENAYDLASALRAMDPPTGGDSIACARQHVAIAEAIRGRQGDEAYRLAGDHIRDVLRIVLPPISVPTAGQPPDSETPKGEVVP